MKNMILLYWQDAKSISEVTFIVLVQQVLRRIVGKKLFLQIVYSGRNTYVLFV